MESKQPIHLPATEVGPLKRRQPIPVRNGNRCSKYRPSILWTPTVRRVHAKPVDADQVIYASIYKAYFASKPRTAAWDAKNLGAEGLLRATIHYFRPRVLSGSISRRTRPNETTTSQSPCLSVSWLSQTYPSASTSTGSGLSTVEEPNQKATFHAAKSVFVVFGPRKRSSR